MGLSASFLDKAIAREMRKCAKTQNRTKCFLHSSIFKRLPFLNELSYNAGSGLNLFVFLISFRISSILFILMRQETQNDIVMAPFVFFDEV